MLTQHHQALHDLFTGVIDTHPCGLAGRSPPGRHFSQRCAPFPQQSMLARLSFRGSVGWPQMPYAPVDGSYGRHCPSDVIVSHNPIFYTVGTYRVDISPTRCLWVLWSQQQWRACIFCLASAGCVCTAGLAALTKGGPVLSCLTLSDQTHLILFEGYLGGIYYAWVLV